MDRVSTHIRQSSAALGKKAGIAVICLGLMISPGASWAPSPGGSADSCSCCCCCHSADSPTGAFDAEGSCQCHVSKEETSPVSPIESLLPASPGSDVMGLPLVADHFVSPAKATSLAPPVADAEAGHGPPLYIANSSFII